MTNNPDKARLLELIRQKYPICDVNNITSVQIDDEGKRIIGWNTTDKDGELLRIVPNEWIYYE